MIQTSTPLARPRPLDENITSVKLDLPNRPQGGGPVTSHFREIAVVDGNGDELTLYEIRDGTRMFGLLPKTRFQLGTGEHVERRGRGFIVPSTGEKLTPLQAR